MPYPWNYLVFYYDGVDKVAAALDVTKSTVYNYVKGKAKMRPHTVVAFNKMVKEMEANYAK